MSRSIFGWSLPPGVTNRMIEDAAGHEGPCEACGRPVDDCICPECPQCGATGDVICYELHGLHLTTEQLNGQDRLKIAELEQRIADIRYAMELRNEPDGDDYADRAEWKARR